MKGMTFYGFTADTPVAEAVGRFVARFGVEPTALWVNAGVDAAGLPAVNLPIVAHGDVSRFAIYLAFPLSPALSLGEREQGVGDG